MQRFLRKAHLYLGCIFAPLLLFFTVTGFLQTFQVHKDLKNGSYQAPQFLKEISEVHKKQRMGERDTENPTRSLSFRYLVALMSVGVSGTILLGVVMAFQTLRRPGPVILCLVAGTVLPVLLLLLGPHV